MATRTVYVTVRIDIDDPSLGEITDEDVNYVIAETDCRFGNVGGFSLETEICGQNE
jgi:hypothetical protein